MKSTLPLLLLLAACPTADRDEKPDAIPEDTAATDTDTAIDDTELGIPVDTADEDADWGGGACDYTVAAVGADELVDHLGGTPAELAALVSGARSTTFHFDTEDIGTDTTLDHTLVVDASSAQLWRGVWVDRDSGGTDTSTWDDDEGDDDGATDVDDGEESDGSGGGSSGDDDGGDGEDGSGDDDGGDGEDGSGGGEDGSGGTDEPSEDPDVDTGESDPEDDTGAFPDTGWEDTGEAGPRCPDYLTIEATWAFETGDGSLAEAMDVSVRALSLSLARIDHTVDASALLGTFVPPVEDPAEWDELRVEFAAAVGPDVDFGEMAIFGTRTWSSSDTGEDSVAEAIMADVARWPAPLLDD